MKMNKEQLLRNMKSLHWYAENIPYIRYMGEDNFMRVGRATPRPTQIDLYSNVLEQIDKNGRAFTIITKSRKDGMSTGISIIGSWFLTMYPSTEGQTWSQDSGTTDTMYGISDTIFSNALVTAWDGENFRTGYNPLPSAAAGPSLKIPNGSEWKFRTQGGRLGKGRGGTPSFLHCTEIPSWSSGRVNTSTGDVMQGLLQSVPKQGLVLVFLESTARGAGDWFHDTWLGAEAGSKYTPKFYCWLDRDLMGDRYSITPPEPLVRAFSSARDLEESGSVDAAITRLSNAGLSTIEIERFREFKQLDAGHLCFWRSELKEMEGNQTRFDEEFPMSAELAFSSSGSNLIPAREIATRARNAKEPLQSNISLNERGESSVQLIEGGGWRIYEEPRDCEYLVVVDACEGIQSKGADNGNIHVFSTDKMEQVAMYNGKLVPESLAVEAMGASVRWSTRKDGYGRTVSERNSLAIVERNGPGLTVITKMMELGASLWSPNGRIGETEPTWDSSMFGYTQTAENRGFNIIHLGKCWRAEEFILHDSRCFDELKTFRKIGDKYQAEPGKHDDSVTSLAQLLHVASSMGLLVGVVGRRQRIAEEENRSLDKLPKREDDSFSFPEYDDLWS